MRIGWQKFLVASVLSGLGILPACTIEVVEGPPADGSMGGSAGTGGAGGAKGDASPDGGVADAPAADAPSMDASSMDAPSIDIAADNVIPETGVDGPAGDVSTPSDASFDGADTSSVDVNTPDSVVPEGGIGDAPPDAGRACFAENPSDAGSTNDCTTLPYYGRRCPDDGGIDPTAGETLCTTLDVDLKATAFQELITCLRDLPGGDGGIDACGSAHEQGSADCSRAIFNRSMCPVPESAVEGGLYGCGQIAASCGPDSGDGGIPVELCQAWLGPFHAAARQGMIDCYLDPSNQGATSCRDKFENYCVFP
ncbi:MAG TPA: hypothetical protein VK550_17230 [Polyangiaceae bacterium]|nr:hypothetical protein [Polyangiaceae bacterium]